MRPCAGVLLAHGPDGMWRVWRAHGGARRCPNAECRSRYYRRVFAAALAGLIELEGAARAHPKFLTLTIPPTIEVPLAWLDPTGTTATETPLFGVVRADRVRVPSVGPLAYRHFSLCFNRLITTLRQHYGVIWYFRVVEETRAGRPHFHLLLSCPAYLPQRRLSQLATRVGLGRIVDIRAIRSRGSMARYAAKCASYAAKSEGTFVPRGFRFFARSKEWGARARVAERMRREARRAKRAAEGWTYAYHSYDEASLAIGELLARGAVVLDERDRKGPERSAAA